MTTAAYSFRKIDPNPALTALLSTCGLPVADIERGGPAAFFGAFSGDALAGVVGLERYGAVGLLRSLAVQPAHRGSGLGRMLAAHAEQQAAAQGVRSLYLLTTSAATFFASLGYDTLPRTEAPAAIQATAQFSGLCPAASTFMCKRLR